MHRVMMNCTLHLQRARLITTHVLPRAIPRVTVPVATDLRRFSSDANANATTEATVAPATPAPATSATSAPKTPRQALLSPLYGLPVRADLPEYTYEEVYTHNRPDSYWIVIDSHVYDVTEYAARHPGGGIEKTFARSHGTDIGEGFNKYHSWKNKRRTATLLIGKIKPGSVSNRVAQPRPADDLPPK